MRSLAAVASAFVALGVADIALADPAPAPAGPPTAQASADEAALPPVAPAATDESTPPPAEPTVTLAANETRAEPPAHEARPPRPVSPDTKARDIEATRVKPSEDDARRDAGAKPRGPDPWREGHGLALEGVLGPALRIGSLQEGYDNEENFDITLRGGAWLSLSPPWAFGLELERTGLGRASSTNGLNSVSAEYDVTAGWLGMRVMPWETENAEFFVELELGLGWQSVQASGTRDSTPITAPPGVYSCSATDGPSFGLGAGIGGSYRLGSHVALVGRLSGTGRQMSSELIDGCSLGAGSVMALGLGAGLRYVFDLGKDAGFAGSAPSQTW